MLGSVNPYLASDATGRFLLGGMQAAAFMKGHWAVVLPGGTQELQDQVIRATTKFFGSGPVQLANLFEKRALVYYLNLAKGLACTSAGEGRGPCSHTLRTILTELDRLDRQVQALPIPGQSLPGGREGPSERLSIQFFTGPDAEDRRDITEQILDATETEVERMRRGLASPSFESLKDGASALKSFPIRA